MKVIDVTAYTAYLDAVEEVVSNTAPELNEALNNDEEMAIMVVMPFVAVQFVTGVSPEETAAALINRLEATEYEEPELPEGVMIEEIGSFEEAVAAINRAFGDDTAEASDTEDREDDTDTGTNNLLNS